MQHIFAEDSTYSEDSSAETYRGVDHTRGMVQNKKNIYSGDNFCAFEELLNNEAEGEITSWY